MLTVKDFSPGDIVYIVRENRGRKESSNIVKRTVKKVGRKYVILNGSGCYEEKYEDWKSDYLHEKADYGEPSLLFKTEEDAMKYLEKKELIRWISNISFVRAEKYSLQQLRAVKQILEN